MMLFRTAVSPHGTLGPPDLQRTAVYRGGRTCDAGDVFQQWQFVKHASKAADLLVDMVPLMYMY